MALMMVPWGEESVGGEIVKTKISDLFLTLAFKKFEEHSSTKTPNSYFFLQR